MKHTRTSVTLFLLVSSTFSQTTDFDLKVEKAVRLTFQPQLGKIYLIQSTPDVKPPRWKNEGSSILGNGQPFQTIFLTESEPHRVFRVANIEVSHGLVGYYPFDGNAVDESGNGNNATIEGAALETNRFALPLDSFAFRGSGQYLKTSTATGFPVGTDDFTVSLWFRPSNLGPSDDSQVIFANQSLNQFQLAISPRDATPTPLARLRGFAHKKIISGWKSREVPFKSSLQPPPISGRALR